MWLLWTTVYSCSWCLALRLSPPHRNSPSRWLEETTWSPSPGVLGSTDWRRLCVRHSARPNLYIMWEVAATQRDRRYGPPISMRSEGRNETFVLTWSIVRQLFTWSVWTSRKSLWRVCFYHIRDLRHVRPALDFDTARAMCSPQTWLLQFQVLLPP